MLTTLVVLGAIVCGLFLVGAVSVAGALFMMLTLTASVALLDWAFPDE